MNKRRNNKLLMKDIIKLTTTTKSMQNKIHVFIEQSNYFMSYLKQSEYRIIFVHTDTAIYSNCNYQD